MRLFFKTYIAENKIGRRLLHLGYILNALLFFLRSVEAGELLEVFLWKSPQDANKEKVKEELADIFAFGLLLADKYCFDLKEIVMEKIIHNGEKYPVEKAKGTAKKYNEL